MHSTVVHMAENLQFISGDLDLSRSNHTYDYQQDECTVLL